MPPHTYSLAIGCLIQAPLAVVFDAWLDARLMETWMKPRPEIETTVELDPREGGAMLIVMRTLRRDETHEGRYELINRPNRLRFSWSSTAAGPESMVDISFLPSAGTGTDTMLLLKHERLESRAARDNHREGWRRILSRLAATLGRQKGATA